MDKDISFGLAILRKEYKEGRAVLVKGDLDLRRLDTVLSDLENIQTAINKIEKAFSQKGVRT